MASPQLALPAGSRRTRGSDLLPYGALAYAAAVLMTGGALVAAYLALRSNADFLPEDLRFDNYLATTLTLTVGMSAVSVEWAADAVRRMQRRQMVAAYSLTAFLGAAFLIGVWALGDESGLAASATPYAVVFYGMLTFAAVTAIVGFVTVLATLGRALGNQVNAIEPGQARATAWVWHAGVAAWIAVWYPLFITK